TTYLDAWPVLADIVKYLIKKARDLVNLQTGPVVTLTLPPDLVGPLRRALVGEPEHLGCPAPVLAISGLYLIQELARLVQQLLIRVVALILARGRRILVRGRFRQCVGQHTMPDARAEHGLHGFTSTTDAEGFVQGHLSQAPIQTRVSVQSRHHLSWTLAHPASAAHAWLGHVLLDLALDPQADRQVPERISPVAGPVMDRGSLELLQAVVVGPSVAAQGFDACPGALEVKPAAREEHAAGMNAFLKGFSFTRAGTWDHEEFDAKSSSGFNAASSRSEFSHLYIVR